MAALILLLRSELWIVLRRDAEVLEEEGVDVRRLLDVLRRAARAVAGVRVYADEDGAIAGLPLLQGRGVLVREEPLGGGDEVVEDLLLVELRPGLMPLLAVLAAAAHVRRGIDEALFEQGKAQRVEAGRRVDVEAAVAVEQCGVVAVEP